MTQNNTENSNIESENCPPKKELSVGDALSCLLLSSFVCGIVFSYEHGYCSYFGIPSSLIRPDVTTYLTFGGFVIIFLISLFILSQLLYLLNLILFKKKTGPLKKFIIKHLIVLTLFLTPAFLIGLENYSFFYIIFWPLFWLLNDLLLILSLKSPSMSYIEAIEKYQLLNKKEKKEFNPTVLDAIKNETVQSIVIFTLLMVFIGMMVNYVGVYNAKHQKLFYVREFSVLIR